MTYEYYWQLKSVSFPASTPGAGGAASAYIDWTLPVPRGLYELSGVGRLPLEGGFQVR